jgi:uncharacterized protein YyaL (SSP411 family)
MAWHRYHLLATHAREVAIVGADAFSVRDALQAAVASPIIWAGSTALSAIPILEDRFAEGKTRIYVCQHGVCNLPTDSIDVARQLLK